MADQATIEDAADIDKQTAQSQGTGSSGGKLRTIIPNVTEVAGIPIVYELGAEGFGPNSTEGLTVNPDSIINIRVGYPAVNYKVFLRYGNNAGYEVIRHITGAYLNFNLKENEKLIAGLSDGEMVWVELRYKDRPDLSGVISYYLTFQQETPKEQEARKAKEQAEKEKNQDKRVSGGPVDTVMQALGDTMGGIAGALGGGTASSGGVKTMSNSGTSSSLGGNVSAVGTARQVQQTQNDYDDDASSESSGEQISGQTIFSTTEVGGGTQTISQGGTVEQTRTTEVTSGGGTVSASQGAAVSGTVTGPQRQAVSGTVGVSGGAVGASAAISGRASVSGAGSSTISVSGAPQASGGGSARVEGALESRENVTGEAQGTVGGQDSTAGIATVQTQVSGTANINQTSPAGTRPAGAAGGISINQGAAAGGTAALGFNLGVSGTVGTSANQNKPAAPTSQNQPQANAPAAQAGAAAPSVTPQAGQTPAPAPTSASTVPPQAPAQNAQSSPAPGKGKVDVIDQGDQPSSDKEQVAPPSAGVQDMIGRLAKNQKDLDNKLDLPTAGQGKGSDTAVPRGQAAGADPLQNLRTAPEAGAPKAEFPRLAPPLISPSKGGGAGKPEGLAPKLISPSKGGGAGEPRLAPPTISPSKGGGAGKPPGLAPKTTSPNKEDSAGEPQQDQDQPPLAAPPPGNQTPKKPGSALEDAEGKLVGETTSQLWWWGFGIAAATFFTGLDFFLGAIIMDTYWVFFYRKQPKLFPLKGWQKLLTVAANLLPFVWASFFFGIVLYAGCNFPAPAVSVLKLAGYGNVCQSFTSLPAGLSGALNGAVAPSTPPAPSAGSCSVMPSGDASPAQLSATCFSAVATQASMVAVKESGGNPAVGSGSDICQDANGNQRTLNGKPEAVSWGLFQINLTAHQVAGLNCPSAFDKLYTAGNHQCQVINVSLYNQCVAAVQDPQTNIQLACQIYQSQGWGAWGTAAQACVGGQ